MVERFDKELWDQHTNTMDLLTRWPACWPTFVSYNPVSIWVLQLLLMSIFLRQRWRFEGNLRKLNVNFSLSAFSSNETAALFSQVWEAWLGRLAIRGQGLMGKDGRSFMMDPSWSDSPNGSFCGFFQPPEFWRPWRWSFKHPNLGPWHHLLFAMRLMFEMNCVRLVKVAKLDTWCSFLLKATWLALISWKVCRESQNVAHSVCLCEFEGSQNILNS